MVRKLRKVLLSIKPDLVVSFSYQEVLLIKVAYILKKTKVVGSERYNPYGLTKMSKFMNKTIFGLVNHMVVQVPDLKLFYANVRNLTVIPNPYFSNNEDSPCKIVREKTIVTASARFEHRKGIDILLKAFNIIQKEYPDYQLKIYGSGQLETEYKRIITELDIKNVYILPPSKNIIQLVKCCEIFVLPSREEGMPNVLIEAMSIGIPCISTNCPPGGPKYLSNNQTRVLLYEVENYQELAMKIKLIINNKELSNSLSENGTELKRILNPTIIFEQWLRVFFTVLEEKNE